MKKRHISSVMIGLLSLTACMPGADSSKPSEASSSTQQCLDVSDGPSAVADGAKTEQRSCTGESDEARTRTHVGSGKHEPVAKDSSTCAKGAGSGTGEEEATCTGRSAKPRTRQSTGSSDQQPLPEPHQRGDRTDSPPPPSGDTGPYGQNAGEYTMTFHDEFNGSSLDTRKWNDHIWYRPVDPTPNYVESDGTLKMFPVAGTEYKRDYRHITTDGLYYQTYGYFETEAKLPFGKGPWPAFWLYNHDQDAHPEIDIMEAYPGGGPDSGWSDANLHPTSFAATVWRDGKTQLGMQKLQTTDLSAAFHKYAVKWQADQLTFYFDGQPYYTLNASIPNRMFILLSFQFGSASNPGDSTTPTGQGNS
ncbi:family 16 glycosylhydrolase, partial [Priestia megaterium]|uniref:family 16 glycosylhydrolase n=1 Tax=Priestia megaterium TaxID=1404 RepID=UPI0036DEEDCA